MLDSRHIVIAVDFSEAGLAAVREGCRLADSCTGNATALHVLEPHGDLALQEGFAPYPVDLRATMTQHAQARWLELSKKLRPLPNVQFIAPVGSAASTLLEQAQPLTSALLVLGINSSEPFRPGAGMVASQCVRYAQSPVLLVAPTFVGPYRHVLLATDFSSTAAIACRWADDLAAKDAATLTALHVQSRRNDGPEIVEERLQAFVKDHAPRTGAAVRHAVTEDAAHRGHTIAKYAAANGVDLIVMGRRGHSTIRHLFVGSTAERVLKHVACNLLLISPSAG